MNIPLSASEVPEWLILKWLLPEGYHCTLNGYGYTISTDCYLVAKALVNDGVVSFNFLPGDRGEEFKKQLSEKHPKYVK